jgi:hypothetical protein
VVGLVSWAKVEEDKMRSVWLITEQRNSNVLDSEISFSQSAWKEFDDAALAEKRLAK